MKIQILMVLLENIAGIFNSKKNILGMMPHPERMVDKLISNTDGNKFIFKFIKLNNGNY